MEAIMDLFNGVGDDDGITVDAVRAFLYENRENDVRFRIDSLGGNLAKGLVIHNLIKSHPKKTTAEIIGMTASAGTIIAEACDEIEQSENVLFLIHNGIGCVEGNVYDFQNAIQELSKNDNIMIGIYEARTGLPRDTIVDLMKRGDWITAQEANEYGFIDTIITSKMKIAANAVIANARAASINQLLITKLESKMKIFGKKDVKSVNILALKNGSQLVISAELPEKGVECAAVGAAALEAGEYEMKDGKILVVDQNGVIVEIKEAVAATAPVAAEAATEEIVEAVVASVNAEIAKVKAEITAEFTAKIEALTKATSAHVPAKGTVNNAPAKTPSVHAKVNSVVEGIRKGIVESRKA